MAEIELRDYATRVQDLLRQHRHEEAVAHCRHILERFPRYLQAFGLLGEAYLEGDQFDAALDAFHKALGADPESMMAHVGLGVIYRRRGELGAALWHIERAYELAPGHAEVRRELGRLYARRDGRPPERLALSRGGLGRLYARSGLHQRAIDEFQAVLGEEPDRYDLRAALAESLWRAERGVEAVEACLDLIDGLPDCLKANLILGEIWLRANLEQEAAERFAVARALDPENLVAQEMMGARSPLPPQPVQLPELQTDGVVPTRSPTAAPERRPVDATEATADQQASETLGIEPEAERGAIAGTRRGEAQILPPAPPVGKSDVRAGMAEGAAQPDDTPAMADAEAAGARPSEGESAADAGVEGASVAGDDAEVVAPTEIAAQAAVGGAEGERLPQSVYGPADLVEDGTRTVERSAGAADPGLEGAAMTPGSETAGAEVGPEPVTPREEVPVWVRKMQSLAKAESVPAGLAFPFGARHAAEPGQTEAGTLPDVGEGEAPAEAGPSASERAREPDPQAPSGLSGAQGETREGEPRYESLRARLNERPSDGDTRLALARLYAADSRWGAALAQYEALIVAGDHLPATIQDLESLLEQGADRGLACQLLGDAHVSLGRLDEALEMYRRGQKAVLERLIRVQ